MVAANLDALWREWTETRSLDVRNRLAEAYLPWLRKVVENYATKLARNSVLQLDDYVQFGVLGMLDAMERFDPSQGYKFKTFALLRIRGAIVDGIRRADWVPRSERRQLADDPERREVTVGRLPMRVSQDTGKEDADVADQQLPPVDDRLMAESIWQEYLTGLPQRDRLMLLLYYREGLTMKQVAAELGVSESRISQLITEVTAQLKQRGVPEPRPATRRTESRPMEQQKSQPHTGPAVTGKLEYVASRFSSPEYIRNQIALHRQMIAVHEREVALWDLILTALSRPAEPRQQPTSTGNGKRTTVAEQIVAFLTTEGSATPGDIANAIGRPVQSVYSMGATLVAQGVIMKSGRQWMLAETDDDAARKE